MHDKKGRLILIATFQSIDFLGVPKSLAVWSLIGCTAVFVISRKGAWGTHLWEGHFEDSDFAGVFNILDGLRQPGAMFHDSEFPHIFIITKRPRPLGPDGKPDVDSVEPMPDVPGDPGMLRKIMQALAATDDPQAQEPTWAPVVQVNYQVLPHFDEEGFDRQFTIPRGKALVQYQPGLFSNNNCAWENAKWRIWIENAGKRNARICSRTKVRKTLD